MARIKNLIRLQQLLAAVCCTFVLGGCSMSQLVARSSLGLIDAGIRSMNQETDLELARAAIPANLKLTESLIAELPGDRSLRIALCAPQSQGTMAGRFLSEYAGSGVHQVGWRW